MAPARAILHVDMDAFYAAVEVRDNPSLAGLPLVVGGAGKRGVVAAASYEARRFGVRSAMPMREAHARCPTLVCVAPRMARYRELSGAVFAVFNEFTPEVEGLSLDEAYLDVTASLGLFGSPERIGALIKARIRAQTGLTASVGVAPNKLVAKIASDLNKPDGLRVVTAAQVPALFATLPVGRLHGIGQKTAERLLALGIRSCGELSGAGDATLKPVFGRYAEQVRCRARGEDDRPVVADWEEKQVSAEETFDTDIGDPRRLAAELAQLADRATARLRAKGQVCGCVTVKIRTGEFQTLTRSFSFAPASDDSRQLARLAQGLLERWLALVPGARLRLLGVALRELGAASQLDLFADGAAAAPSPANGAPNAAQPGARLDPTLDHIRSRFGSGAVTRASSLTRREPPRG